MSINLVTYANQTVTPTNDAIIYEKAIDQNGIFYGCNVTVTSNTVNITGGYGIVCGREFVINSDSLTVTLAPSGTLQGRLYVRLDLADADAPIQLLTATGNTLPALEQDDDVNFTNGVYEMELATFTVGVSSLSDVVETFEEIEGTKEGYVKDISDKIAFGSAWSSIIKQAYLIGGKFVFFTLEGYADTIIAGTQYTIATIASGYRPKDTLAFTGHATKVGYFPQSIVNCFVWTSGDMTVRCSNGNGNYVFVSGWYLVA